jgi:hypothetical protein
MRVVLIGLALLGMTAPARAGVYCTIDPTPELPPERIRSWVAQMRAVAVDPKKQLDPASLRAYFLRHRDSLEQEKESDVFSTIDLLNLSACYIRLGELNKAIRLLNSAPERKHFLVQANLASAYFLRSQSLQAEGEDLLLAHRCQEQALDAWPDVWAPFKPGQLVHFRRCERTFLTLLEKRRDEASLRRNPGPVDIDAIFPGFRLVGPGPAGEYEAGALSGKVLDRLPADAYTTVRQLVLWYPQDLRLYWLLGEFLNIFGHVIPAEEILTELLANDLPFKDLRKHRRVLQEAAALLRKLNIHAPSTQALLLACLSSIPNGSLLPGGAGAAAKAVAVAAPLEMARLIENPPQNVAGPPASAPFVFTWRHVLAGFGFGFLMAALIGFQWQERRRRRMMREIEPPDEEEPAAPTDKENAPR